MSQPASGGSRSTRSTVKRALSVDDLNVELQSTSTENLHDAKLNGKFIVVNSKRRRKLKQKQANQLQQMQQSQPHNDSDGMDIHTIDSQNLTESARTEADLRNEVQSLRQTVKTLQNELDFVLSFLGITNTSRQSTNVEQPVQQTSHAATAPNHTDGAVSSDVLTSLNSVTTDPPTNNPDVSVSNDRLQTTQSYANIACKPAALSAPFRHAVISAVYTDFEEKDRRARNVVISGLMLSSVSDKVTVEELCNSEFGFVPKIIKCRRLGQPRPGRVQPVHVVLESVTDAEFLVKNAKLLRRSTDSVVRDSVFINADLTKAEALTAYQRRCRRRELAAARRSAGNGSVSQPITVLNTRMALADQSSTQSTSFGAVTSLQLPDHEQPTDSNDQTSDDHSVGDNSATADVPNNTAAPNDA